VAELGFEYDDNNYYRGECSGSYPRTAYRSEDKARQVCEELNLIDFKSYFNGRDIKSYGDLDWMIESNEENNKIFSKLFGTDVEGWWANDSVDFVIKPTKEDWETLYNCFKVSWYTVCSVKMSEE
jgi:hypothetical protein